MIARIYIIIILAIVLPDIYIYWRFLRKKPSLTQWHRLLWWLPCLLLATCTTYFSLSRHFVPQEMTLFNAYMFVLALSVIPKLLFCLCSLAGMGLSKAMHMRHNYGNHTGIVAALGSLYVLFTGCMTGVGNLNVRRMTLEFDSLPTAFDGYRIVQFSDAHLGSIKPDLLERAVAEINDMKPDAIVFTGDLQNMLPDEIVPHTATLSSLKARDGVFSVLGNHDYSIYTDLPPRQKVENEKTTQRLERSMGWRLLMNEHHTIRRGADSIVMAGYENDGKRPFPSKGSLAKALRGVDSNAFVVMLQHDPSAWRRNILTHSNAQLTLSGHTHGGQISIMGWRPTKLVGKEDAGLYDEDGRKLFVSIGLGGVLPFRFHSDPEIVEITLKTRK